MPAVEKIQEDVTTPMGRLSYPNLDPERPRINEAAENPAPEWSADLLLDPNGKPYQMFCQKLETLRQAFIAKHKQEPKHSPGFKRVGEFSDAAGTKPNPHEIVGLMKFTARQRAEGRNGKDFPPPQLIGFDQDPISHRDLYGGCYVRFVISVREYEYKNAKGAVMGRGLSADLKAVQFIKDGTPFGAGRKDYTACLDEDPYGEDIVGGKEETAPASTRRELA